MRPVGRATIGSAVVFAVAITGWILQRPTEPEPVKSIPWPDVSWVIVTTTSTTVVPKPSKAKPTTTDAPKNTEVATSLPAEPTTTVPETQTTVTAEPSSEGSTTTVATIN